jgi:hypothetical protein
LTATPPAWVEQGPATITNSSLVSARPDNGSVGAVESIVVENVPVSQQNPGGHVVYAGTVNGGVWRADNITDSMVNGSGDPTTIDWRPLTDNQPSLATTSLALDPNDLSGNTLWVGTGSQSSAGFGGGPSVGLLYTKNGGQNWFVRGQGLAKTTIMSIAPTTLMPPTGQVVLVADYNQGLERSADGGVTFQPVNLATGGVLGGSASDVVADPATPQIFFAAVANQGVYESTDGGVSWFSINNNIQGTAGSIDIRLAVHSDTNGLVLYAGIINSNDTLTAVYRAVITSGQPNWFPIGRSTLPNLKSDLQVPGFRYFAMTADPTDDKVVYVSGIANGTTSSVYRVVAPAPSGQGIWISLHNSIFPDNQPHPDSRHLAFLGNGILLETDDGGIYGLPGPRDNPGTLWTTLSFGLRDTEFFSVAYDAENGDVLGGTQDNGTVVQPGPNGLFWDPVPKGDGDGGNTAFDDSVGLTYFFRDDGFFIDNRNGDTRAATLLKPGTAFPLFGGLNKSDLATYVANFQQTDASFPYALNSYKQTRVKPILMGMTGVYESFDAGTTINDVSPPAMSGNVTALASGVPTMPDAAYFATSNPGAGVAQIFVRSRPGASFTQTNWPGAAVRRIVIDPDNWQIAYAVDSSGKVWRTTDAGGTPNPKNNDWVDITSNLSSLTPVVRTLEIYDPTPQSNQGDEVLLAGGRGGVFRLLHPLDPPGGAWTQYGTGLPNVLVNDLHYIPGTGFGDILVAGTLGRGAWTIPAASKTLSQAIRLQISFVVGDFGYSVVRLVRDASDPRILDVFVGSRSQPDFTVPLAVLQDIEVTGLGNDTLIVDNSNGRINVPDLFFSGGAFPNTLQIQSGSDTQPENAVFDVGTITGLGPGTLHYSNVSVLSVSGGTGRNDYTVNGLDKQVSATIMIGDGDQDYVDVEGNQGPVTIFLGQARDGVDISAVSRTLSAIQGTVTVHGGGAFGVLGIHDQVEAVPQTYTITASSVTRQGSAPINFDSIDEVELDGDVRGGVYNVQDTPGGGTSTTLNLTAGSAPSAVNVQKTTGDLQINTGKAAATVNVGNAGSVRNIMGAVGISGLDVGLFVDDSNDPTTRLSPTLSASSLTGLAGATIDYSGAQLAVLDVRGGSGGDAFTVTGTPFNVPNNPLTTLQTGSGNSTVNVRATEGRLVVGSGRGNISVTIGSLAPALGGALGRIEGPIIVTNLLGHDALVIDDSGDNTGRSATITASSVTGLSPAAINYAAGPVSSVTVYGGGKSNTSSTFRVKSTSPATPVSIFAGAGTNTLVGPNTASIWNFALFGAGSVGNVGFSRIQNVKGGTALNIFKFSPGSALAGTLAGGGAGDWLEYPGLITPVSVNLATGAATDVGGGTAGKVSQIQNVIGGAGDNTLVGNALGNILIGGGGTNVITGGSGRSVLIGGTGSATITGGAADDILIAGTTTFDTDEGALMAILKEWQRTDKIYTQRITDLRNGGGYNGANKLIWHTTVLDNDRSPSLLIGGTGLDWFFANLTPTGVLDQIRNRNSQELVD